MSIGIWALKIGLVTTVAGTAVATPILLKRNSAGSSTVTAQTPHSEITAQRPETISGQESSLEESNRAEDRTNTDNGSDSLQRAVERTDVSRGQVVSSSPQATAVSFDKTCFEVPATSDSDNNMQLLTCFETAKLKDAHREGIAPEFDSTFHIYNKDTRENPVKIEGKMEWNFGSQKISFYLNSNSEGTKYTFTVDKSKWGNSLEEVSDLKGECAIFQVTSKDYGDKKEYWLACSDDTEEFEAGRPKGIKLTNWTRR